MDLNADFTQRASAHAAAMAWTPSLVTGVERKMLDPIGGFEEGDEAFTRGSWLRLPPGAPLRAQAGPAGASVWIKEGHLAGPIGGPAQ